MPFALGTGGFLGLAFWVDLLGLSFACDSAFTSFLVGLLRGLLAFML